ncbi:MAG: DUF885 domain-containing protein, partial [Chloroflexota bacterium]|nr:DUF885 domain-containing protein [Chloroflexota bacterium]
DLTQPTIDAIALRRPEPAPDPGPLDDRFYDLVEARFRRIVRDHPDFATFVGIHTEDHRLGAGERDAVLGEIAADRAHLTTVEAIDPKALSAEARFERDLEMHNVRRDLFDADVVRTWERRSTALDGVGDPLFALFARDFAPLAERLDAMTSRLEAVPAFLAASKSRAVVPQVRLWQTIEIETAGEMPTLFDEIVAAGTGVLGPAELRRLQAASDAAKSAVTGYVKWLEASLAGGTDDWALGRERYDELVGLRGFDGLDADAILAIGEEQLVQNAAARVETAREIDPNQTEKAVVDRLKSAQPATFAAALEAYRNAMLRARAHLIEHDIVTVPADERIEVIPTPEYLRNIIPFAAYVDPPMFDEDPNGIYIVTPSVGDDPNAMREHNYSSISNTSIHEAYPGHHLQLSVAGKHPSLTRALTNAPEFVEGWGMYSEQMMREQGFDDAPSFRLGMYTDAIWRACRIILDVRMHRGELSVDESTRFLVDKTRFEEANARAEILRYTYTPTYQLSYLLGKVLLLQLRTDEQERLGSAFSLKGFHDRLLQNASLPISFHRRLLREEGGSKAGGGSATERAAAR